MRIPFEEWLNSEQMNQNAFDLFRESVICYKSSAYRAALLFSYLGFLTVVRDRVLSSNCPTGTPPGQWNDITKKLTDEDKWDTQAFEITQAKSGSNIFLLSDDIRHQVMYWKNRRNDCAHSKPNEIGFSHVESFWMFLKSNLGRFVVNGSRQSILASLQTHFDYSLTPRGTDPTHIITQISNSITPNEVTDFFNDVYKVFHPTSIKPQDTSPFSLEEANFWAMMLEKGNNTMTHKLMDFLKQDSNALLLYEILRNKTTCVHYFSTDDKLIRKLWFTHLFSKSHDFPIYCALIRNGLIPEKQLEEAHDAIIKRLCDTVINDEQFAILKDNGFWDRFRKYVFTERQISEFNWANRNSTLIVQYLERFDIDNEIAIAIQQTFSSPYYPWHLRDALNELFLRNIQKRKDLLNILSDKKLDPPINLDSLKNHDSL